MNSLKTPENRPEKRVCGAKNRAGTPCQRAPTVGKRRCRLHGGAPGSGAPEGERNGRYVHGRFSRVKRAERQAAMDAASREWLAKVPKWDWRKLVEEICRDGKE